MFTPAQIGHTVSAIASTFEGLIPELGTVAGVDQTHIAIVTKATDDLHQAAEAFASADASAAGGDILDRVEADVNAVLAVAGTLPLPPQVVLPLRIAQILLPTVLAAGHLVFPKL